MSLLLLLQEFLLVNSSYQSYFKLVFLSLATQKFYQLNMLLIPLGHYRLLLETA